MKALLKRAMAFSVFIILSQSASLLAQTGDSPSPSKVQCQAIDSQEVANPEFAVENFDRNTQAFLMCATLPGETGPEVFLTGSLPIKKGAKLSLEDFTAWNQNPALSDIFIKSSSGTHQLKSFLLNTLPVDVEAIDVILGIAKSRPTTQQVCTTTSSTAQSCTIKQVEECKIVYGRKECKMVDKEVCTNSNKPIQTCSNQTVITYYRTLPALDGYLTMRPDNFCPYGVIEKQTKTVYGRVFNERRCCESKVVSGVLTNVCTAWIAL
jgi:hypothetical protein